MHCPDIGKSAAGVADCELFTGMTFEEKQPGIGFGPIGCDLLFRINTVKNLLTCQDPAAQGVDDLNCFTRIDPVVPGQRKISKGVAVVVSGIDREEQSAVSIKSGIANDI